MKDKIQKENQKGKRILGKGKEKKKETIEKMQEKETYENEKTEEIKETEINKKKITKAKIKAIANRFFNSIGFPIVIGILLFLKTIFFYLNTISILETIDKGTILGTIAFIATLTWMISVFLPNRGRIVVTIGVDIIISILLLADNLYHAYSSSILSIAQIMNLQYGEEIMSTLPMLLRARHLLYFIDIIVVCILLFTKILKIEKKKKLAIKYKIIKVILGVGVTILFFFMDKFYISLAKEDPFNKDMQVKKSTIYGYHISDIGNTINIKNQAKYDAKEELMADYEELKREYDEKYSETNYDLKGYIKGKNVIILQLESIQNFVINKKINGKEITPNLNKFINENIEITNMFMQSYSSTADSEFSSITSLYPMENGMSYSRYYTNTYDNIFTMFENEGYTTSYMHGNYGYFWNRGNVYKAFGVQNIELKDSFADTSEDINGYLSDELLYTQAVEKLKDYNKPFMSYIVSASSHTPFYLLGLEDKSKVSINVGKYENTFLGCYLEAVNYADYAFGIFIEKLKEADLYDDTVILLYGDHNGMDMYNEHLEDFLKETDPNLTDTDIKLNYIRVACGMKIPGMEHIKIEKPVSKLDIKPTFAYLIDGNPGFSLGTNMFGRKDFICLNNERIVTSRYYFDEKWYRIKDGVEVNLEEIPQDERELLDDYYEKMRRELDISISVSINDLLK